MLLANTPKIRKFETQSKVKLPSPYQYIAAGSEDTVIKVVPVDKSEEFFELTGHEGPILKIDTSPKGLLASASGDGTIRIWDLNERKEVKIIRGFEKATSFYNAKTFGNYFQI